MVSSTEYVGIEVTLKYFAEDKGNRNNWLYPRCLEALRSIFEMGTLFHMSRTFNIVNLQFKWLQELLDIDFPKAGIIQGRYHQAQHIFYLPEIPQTCPIDWLTHQGSQFSVKRILFCRACNEESTCEWPLTWYRYMCSFCSGSPLISHSRYQQHSPWSGKTTNIWICPISTSDIPCIDIQYIFHPSSNFFGWHNSTSYYHQGCKWWGWWMAMWSMV